MRSFCREETEKQTKPSKLLGLSGALQTVHCQGLCMPTAAVGKGGSHGSGHTAALALMGLLCLQKAAAWVRAVQSSGSGGVGVCKLC